VTLQLFQKPHATHEKVIRKNVIFFSKNKLSMFLNESRLMFFLPFSEEFSKSNLLFMASF